MMPQNGDLLPAFGILSAVFAAIGVAVGLGAPSVAMATVGPAVDEPRPSGGSASSG